MGIGKCFTTCPCNEVFHCAPASLDLVEFVCVWIVNECSGVMVNPNWSRPMNLVADESGRLVDEVDSFTETILEINLMPFGYRNAIGYNDSRCSALILKCWPCAKSTLYQNERMYRAASQFCWGQAIKRSFCGTSCVRWLLAHFDAVSQSLCDQ